MRATALNVLFEGFLLSREANGVSKTTLDAYRFMFKHLCSCLPDRAIRDPATITVEDIQQWSVSMASYANATRDQRIAKAKAFFNWLVAEAFLEDNPVKIKKPKNNWQPDPLSQDEIAMFLEYAKKAGARDYAICCMFLDSGVRSGELSNLRPGDVTLKTGQIKVTEGKGGKSRTTFIGKKARDALWRWMIQRPEDSDWLFCTNRGGQMTKDRMRKLIAKIGREVGIRAYPHRLRHTFATWYIKRGGDPYTLQYLLGHEDMTVTRMYVKMAAQDVTGTYRSLLDGM